MNKIGTRLSDLKNKDVLRPRKVLKGNKELMEKNCKPEAKVTKTRMSSFGNRSVRFFHIK
jgi:hypothetical protein